MIPETIHWHDAEAVKPAAGHHVFVETRDGDIGEGFLCEQGYWRTADGRRIWNKFRRGKLIDNAVIAWTQLPKGTRALHEDDSAWLLARATV